jgi:hypothetical protein
MSTPFDDLPAPSRHAAPAPAAASPTKREREQEEEDEQQPQQKQEPKRPRHADDDPVAAALARLTPHLRAGAARISKAGPLLRQLLDGDGAQVDPSRHAAAAFNAVAAAFADPSQFLSAAPAARLEYARVARSAQRAAAAGLFAGNDDDDDDEEKEEGSDAACRAFFSECAAAWAQLRLELLSAEDSFALSKALTKVKALVDGLPDWQEGDEVEEEVEKDEAAAAAAAPARRPSPPTPIAWPPGAARVLLLRRRAALDCALCARDHVHGRPGAAWAAAAVEPALEHVASGAPKFAPGPQRRAARALAGWVSARRAARRAGAAGAGAGGSGGAPVDDRGAFERARASFARMGDVSARGSVGLKGGGAGAPWLG